MLVGPEHRQCLPSGEWSGTGSTICQSKCAIQRRAAAVKTKLNRLRDIKSRFRVLTIFRVSRGSGKGPALCDADV